MGSSMSSCSRPRNDRDDNGEEQIRAGGVATPSIQRSGNQIPSSNQDIRNTKQPHQQQPMRSNEPNVAAAVERFYEVTARMQFKGLIHSKAKERLRKASVTCRVGTATPHKENRSDATLLFTDLGDKECPICLEGYDTQNPQVILKCRHHHHKQCILQWMEKSRTCPTCRQAMVFETIIWNLQF